MSEHVSGKSPEPSGTDFGDVNIENPAEPISRENSGERQLASVHEKIGVNPVPVVNLEESKVNKLNGMEAPPLIRGSSTPASDMPENPKFTPYHLNPKRAIGAPFAKTEGSLNSVAAPPFSASSNGSASLNTLGTSPGRLVPSPPSSFKYSQDMWSTAGWERPYANNGPT
eukprot:Platyproteum_vivax@DN17296_c0_g1_i1.p1